MLTKNIGRLAAALALLVAWLWIQSIGSGAVNDAGERRDILAVRAALKVGDSLRASRQQSKVLAGAIARKGDVLMVSGGTLHIEIAGLDSVLHRAKTLADSNHWLQRLNIKLSVQARQYYEAAQFFNEARTIDSTRADQAEMQLGVMMGHTVTMMRRLEARKSFHLGFVTLPRPKKWQAALGGVVLGALLDDGDRVRGAAIGAALGELVVPTR